MPHVSREQKGLPAACKKEKGTEFPGLERVAGGIFFRAESGATGFFPIWPVTTTRAFARQTKKRATACFETGIQGARGHLLGDGHALFNPEASKRRGVSQGTFHFSRSSAAPPN